MVRLTETLAEETRPFRVDINVIAPGALATRLKEELCAAGSERIGAAYHARIKE